MIMIMAMAMFSWTMVVAFVFGGEADLADAERYLELKETACE